MGSADVHRNFNSAAEPQLRVFTNPPIKQEIPADFPDVITDSRVADLSVLLSSRLKKFGIDNISDVGCIHIAYPHKHPQIFPNHENGARMRACNLASVLGERYPQVEWRLASEICDTVHLDRLNNRGLIHELTKSPNYMLCGVSDIDPPRFLNPDLDKKHYFIVVDWITFRGTTLANLMSYIHYNGGTVLAAVSGKDYGGFQQKPDDVFERDHKHWSLSGEFSAPGRNNGRLKQLAHQFSTDMKVDEIDMSPQVCIEKFDTALRTHGNTVFALTDRECQHIMTGIQGGNAFGRLLKKMEQEPPQVIVTSLKL